MLRENLEEEAVLMKDVPGWKVKEGCELSLLWFLFEGTTFKYSAWVPGDFPQIYNLTLRCTDVYVHEEQIVFVLYTNLKEG